MSDQLAIDFASLSLCSARAAGEQGMAISLESAQRADPDFAEKAKAAILAHLRVVRECSGEDLTDIAKAKGARPANGDRAFGGVFLSLQRQHLIRCLRSDLPRKRGHGTTGGKLWGLVPVSFVLSPTAADESFPTFTVTALPVGKRRTTPVTE